MNDRTRIHRDLDNLENCANRNLMTFYKEENKLLHLGQCKPTHNQRIGSSPAENKTYNGRYTKYSFSL